MSPRYARRVFSAASRRHRSASSRSSAASQPGAIWAEGSAERVALIPRGSPREPLRLLREGLYERRPPACPGGLVREAPTPPTPRGLAREAPTPPTPRGLVREA